MMRRHFIKKNPVHIPALPWGYRLISPAWLTNQITGLAKIFHYSRYIYIYIVLQFFHPKHFHYYRGGQFFVWRKTTDLPLVTDKFYHWRLYKLHLTFLWFSPNLARLSGMVGRGSIYILTFSICVVWEVYVTFNRGIMLIWHKVFIFYQ